jgi:hypothetical protein
MKQLLQCAVSVTRRSSSGRWMIAAPVPRSRISMAKFVTANTIAIKPKSLGVSRRDSTSSVSSCTPMRAAWMTPTHRAF